jgi:TetR/AcrR family transcriptional repressor of nem operon
MRYDAEHKARTRQRIVKNAARQLRAKGLNEPGVADLMKASGLTVGGFYKHFQSRDHLLAEAIEQGLADFTAKVTKAIADVPTDQRWKEIVKFYLSMEHCEHPDKGCPMAALAPDIARAAPVVKTRIARILKAQRERLLDLMPGQGRAEKERNFIVIFTSMGGAMQLARTLPNPAEKQSILDSVRDHLLNSF